MTSLSFPPPSILTHTQEIINVCEDAEVQAHVVDPSNNSIFAGGSGSVVPPSLDVILVTQLAALIHAGEYHDALNLYLRYAGQMVTGSGADGSGNNDSGGMSLPQFALP